ncbi:MAG: deoxyribose-phosphate aldolase [Bryobacteraceae bacterium]
MDTSGDPIGAEARPPLTTYEDLAKMIDHSLLRPELSEEQIVDGCDLARSYNTANVTVRPCDVDSAVRRMQGSGIAVGTVVGFPHGSTTTAAKLYEARDLVRRGATEIDAVINIGRLISRQFQDIETELLQLSDTCHQQGAILKVIFENAYLTHELKVIACRICKRAGVDYIKTSTGFAPSGYMLEDLHLMRKHGGAMKVKAAGGVRTLEAALEVYQAGCSRIGATATAAILDAWKEHLKRLAAEAQANAQQPASNT